MGTHYQLLLGIRDERTRAPSLLLVSVDPSGLLSFSGESEDSNDPARLDQCAIRDSCAGLPSLCYAVSFLWTVNFPSLSSQNSACAHSRDSVNKLVNNVLCTHTHIITHI